MGVLHGIFNLIGVPREENWPGVTTRYPMFNKIVDDYYKSRQSERAPQNSGQKNLKSLIEEARKGPVCAELVDLLKQMLILSPQRRISAAEALNHAYL